MKIYANATDGLRSVLMQYTKGYTKAVIFDAPESRLETLQNKFAEAYGTQLPGWKRYQRKQKGLPNAWACAFPKSSYPGHYWVVLLAVFDNLDGLDKSSPWRNEKWLERVIIGDYIITTDQRDRRDYTMTFKLQTGSIKGLEAHWRMIADRDLDGLVHETQRAVKSYAMFGGVRRQLRRLIRGYAKLYKARRHKDWPGPDPENLPMMGAFKKTLIQ